LRIADKIARMEFGKISSISKRRKTIRRAIETAKSESANVVPERN